MPRELKTIQSVAKLNRVYAVDAKGPGGANHRYEISLENDPKLTKVILQFQKGPRKEADSTHGVLECDLLEIIRDRLKSFQEGPYSSEYNEIALTHVELALDALNARVVDRLNRDVLGKSAK